MNTHSLNDIDKNLLYKTALVIDDDPFSQNLAASILEGLGIENISMADSGATAMRMFDKMSVKPDLIICDLFMPGKDGIEVLNELGQRHYTGGIILVTAGDLSILQVATGIATSGNSLRLLGALPKPLCSHVMGHVLGALNVS